MTSPSEVKFACDVASRPSPAPALDAGGLPSVVQPANAAKRTNSARLPGAIRAIWRIGRADRVIDGKITSRHAKKTAQGQPLRHSSNTQISQPNRGARGGPAGPRACSGT